jgi:separase
LCRQKAGLLLKTMADVVATEHTPILLLPDVSYNELPWESLTCSRGYNIYRLPNALSLNDKYLKDKSTRHISVDVANSFALLNPNGDLVGTEKALRPVLDKYRWHVVCGQPPTDLRAMLREYNLFLFFGHGAAIDFLGHLKFRTSLWRSTMILMGCSSGALRHSIDSPSDIPVVCYLVAGSPAILANLWDVTDAEIDRFSLSLLNSWSCRVEKTQMIEFDMSASVRESRTSCRLPYLTGGAPVVYGLPVHFLPIN